MIKGHQPAVHLCPNTTITDIGMNAISKVHRSRSAGKFYHVAARRKNIDFIGKEIALQCLHVFCGIGSRFLPFHQLTHPGQFFIKCRLFTTSFFILPMGGNTKFRCLVHFKSTNLYFKGFSAGANQRRMQRLVHILFGHGNVILKTLGNRLPKRVYNAQNGIAILDGIDNYANSGNIKDLSERLVLLIHFFINGIESLWSTGNLKMNAYIVQFLTELIHNMANIFLPFLQSLMHQCGNLKIGVRIEIFQAQILKL